MGNHGHRLGDHEGGVEAHAELADDIHIRIGGQILLKLQGAALGDGAQVLFHLLLGHADAVVRNGQQPVFLVGLEGDGEVRPVQTHALVRQRLIGQLVDGVRSVGDNLPEENLLICIDRVNHQIQQPLGFSLELFLFHGTCPFRKALALFIYEC